MSLCTGNRTQNVTSHRAAAPDQTIPPATCSPSSISGLDAAETSGSSRVQHHKQQSHGNSRRPGRWRSWFWLIVPIMAHAALIFGIQFMTTWYDVECAWYNPGDPQRTPQKSYMDQEPVRAFSMVGIFNMTCEAPISQEKGIRDQKLGCHQLLAGE